MSNKSRVQAIAVPWRKVCAALPAVTLIGASIAFAAPSAPARDIMGAVSNDSPAIVVPDTALTMPDVPAPIWTDPYVAPGREVPARGKPVAGAPGGSAPALELPGGTLPGSSTPVALDSTGIPIRALEAYRRAATLISSADPSCYIDWALLAAIGRVESNHARFGGNQLDAAGVAQPGIIGIALDGTNSTARITDSDGGLLDRDSVYDRAVGPMQFIPSTWRAAGADADGDGVKNPQDMTDAASAAAIYLCSGPGDLRLPGDLHAAIMRYNHSDSYAATVTAIAAAYRHGVTALPASDLPAANSAPSISGAAKAAPRHAAPLSAAPEPAAPKAVMTKPAAPVPCVTNPTPTEPAPTAPCLPDPCLPRPTPTDPTPTPGAGVSPPTPPALAICAIVPLDAAPTPTL